ncbi:hypothetical protein BGW38_004330 [Lunasporangiospora selenospora]|uniref:Uncharacterized protein n=1 Tax=Lunasporangiospora selenospora TaxID=979761 RepID=A0A9P6FRG7_9FUNG|nr:hypothetical protein BGW38_004330 [Lunasporangiospora selenospora]
MEPPLLHRVPDQSSTQAGGSTMSRGLHGRHPSASATLKRPMTKIDPSLFSEEQADYPRDDAWNKETDKAPLYEYIDHVKDITEVKAIPLHTSKQMNVAAIAVPAAMASGPLHHMVLDLHSHHDQPIVGQSASKLHSVSGAESAPMYQHSRGHSTAGALWRPKYSYFLFPEEEADYPRDDVYDPQANAPFRVRLPTRDIKEVQLDSAHRRPHHDLHPSLAESAAAAFRSMFGGLASHAEEAIAATAVAATMATTARYHVPEAPATERGQGSTVPDPTTLKFPESHEVDPHSYKDLELDLTLSAPQDYPSPAMTAKSDLPMKDLSREAGASQKREQVSGAPWTASSTVDPLPADQMHPGIVPVYVEPAVRVEVPAPMTMHRSGHDLAQGAAAGATLAGIGAMGAHALTVDKTAKEASRRHFRPSEHHSRMMVIHCITDDPEEYLLSADELHSPVVSSTLPLSAMALPTDTSIILNRKYESLSVLPKTPDLAKGSMVAHPMSSGHTVPAAKVALPLGAAAVTAAAFGSHRDRSELASTPRSQNRISIAQPPPELLAASKSTRPGARMPLSGTSSRPLSEAIRSAAPLMGAAAGSSQVGSQGRPKPATVPDTQAIKGLEEPHVSKVIPLAAAAGIAVPTLVAAPRAAQPAIQPASDDASTGTISHAVDIQPLAIHSKDPIVVSKVTPSEPKEDPTGTQETMHGPLKQDHEHDEDNRHQQPHLTNVAAPPLPIHHQHSPDDHSVHLSNVAAPRFPIEHHHHHPGDPSVHLTNVAAPRVRRPSEEPHSAQQHHQQEAPLYSAEKQSHSLPQSAVPAAALMGATTAMIPAMIAGQSRQSIDEQPKLPELGHDSHPLQGPTDTARIQMPRDQLHSETEGGISLPQTLPSARPEGGVKAFGASVPTATTLPLAGVPATERDIAMTAPPTDTGLTMPLPLTQAETESQTSHFEAPSVSSAPAPVPIPSGRPISMEYTGEPKLTTASMDMSTMPAGTLGLHHDTDSSVGPHRDDPIPAQRPATVSAPGLASVSHTAVTSTLPKTEEGMSGPGSKTEIYPEEIKSSRPAATAAAIGTALPIATAAAVSGTRSQNHETQDRPQVQSAARDPFVVMPPRVDETRALSQPYLQPQATALPLSQRAIPAPPEGYSGPMPQLNEGETVIWVKKVYTTEEFYDPEDDDGRQLDAYGNRLDRDVSLHLPHRQQQSGTRHGPSQ